MNHLLQLRSATFKSYATTTPSWEIFTRPPALGAGLVRLAIAFPTHFISGESVKIWGSQREGKYPHLLPQGPGAPHNVHYSISWGREIDRKLGPILKCHGLATSESLCHIQTVTKGIYSIEHVTHVSGGGKSGHACRAMSLLYEILPSSKHNLDTCTNPSALCS